MGDGMVVNVNNAVRFLVHNCTSGSQQLSISRNRGISSDYVEMQSAGCDGVEWTITTCNRIAWMPVIFFSFPIVRAITENYNPEFGSAERIHT